MTGFNSTDDFVSEVTTNGKFWRADWMKILTPSATLTAGRWHELEGFGGNPVQRLAGNMCLNGDFMSTSYPWVLGTANWAYTPATHLVTRTANADVSTVSQTVKCIPGEIYTVLYTITRSAGTIAVSLGGTAGTSRNAAGTYREELVMGTSNSLVSFVPDATFAGTVDLVNVFRQRDFTPYSDESENAIYTGPYPSGSDTKHIVNMGAWNNALLGSPAVLMLVDILGVYPSIKTNTALPQYLTHGNRLRNGLFIGNANGWTLGSNWAYSGTNTVVRTSAADTATLSQSGLDILDNVPYVLKYTMSSSSGAGTITPSFGDAVGTPRTADGTYTETLTSTIDASTLTFTPTSGNIGTTITDVSLKPAIPRYTDGAGVRLYASTAFDNLPTTGAQVMAASYQNTTTPTYYAVDSMDSTSGWTDSANMTVTVNTTTYQEGRGGLNLTKDNVTTALCSTEKTTTSVNFTNGKLQFWYYCASAAAYAKLAAAGAALTVRFGSDSSNYYRWDLTKAQLLGLNQAVAGAGWQFLELSVLTPTAVTGTPVITACDYTYFGLTASDGTTISWSAGDFIIDDVKVVVNGQQLGATVANTASSIASHILHSGVAAQNYGPFLPLQAGDTGVSKVESVTFTGVSAAAGAVNLYLVKPLATIPLPVGFVASERDLMNQLPSLPKIHKCACLGLLMFAGAATVSGTQVQGFIDFAWG